MRIVIKYPNEKPRSIFINNQLRAFQDLVGGFIEVYPLKPDLLMIINEDGKQIGEPLNFFIPNDYIAGTAIFVGKDGEDFTDCPYTVGEIEEIIEGLDV
jgi:hypothetical protein